MEFMNSYEDSRCAEAYARLEFSGTYYLAYRDLPAIITTHTAGGMAVDFGCGSGRSTRFLKQMGFKPIGVDIAEDMIKIAGQLDPAGDYRLIKEGDLRLLDADAYDLVLSVFTFDNIPTQEKKISLFKEMRNLLNRKGKIINLVSDPAIYVHEWASFSTAAFPENRYAKSGDRVKIIITDSEDKRPVEDIVCSAEDYRNIFSQAGLKVIETYKPLGREDEPQSWINETRIAPWVIYVLAKV